MRIKRKINETSTRKYEATIYYNGIIRNEDPADYVKIKSIKAVKLA